MSTKYGLPLVAALGVLLNATPGLALGGPGLKKLYETAHAYDLTIPEYVTHENMIIAHGAMMAFAFAFMFPFGAAMIRIWHPGTIIWLHAWWQVTAILIASGGFGMGVWLATTQGQLHYPNGHPIIGMIVVPTLILMPGIGWAHHLALQKLGVRNVATHAHVWIGRIMLIAGGINGGLGIRMNDEQHSVWLPSYVSVAGFFYLVWLISTVQWEIRFRRKMKKERAADVERNSQRGSLSSEGAAMSEHESAAGIGKVYYEA